jgi:hypothetical protein
MSRIKDCAEVHIRRSYANSIGLRFMPIVVSARWNNCARSDYAACRFVKAVLVNNRINWRNGLLSVIFK